MLGIAGAQFGRFQFAHPGEPVAFHAHERDGYSGHTGTRALKKTASGLVAVRKKPD